MVSANADGRRYGRRSIAGHQKELAETRAAPRLLTDLEGTFQAQEEAACTSVSSRCVSLATDLHHSLQPLSFGVLALIIMGSIPLALIGSVAALVGRTAACPSPSMIGFITLAGITARNGILKISHYINLMAHEGEVFGRQLVIRGSLERLAPVLMTAMIAAFALLPLMLSGDQPGKEILHPVAVVIFGGLISSTLLDTLLTPVMFYTWGEEPVRRLLEQTQKASDF